MLPCDGIRATPPAGGEVDIAPATGDFQLHDVFGLLALAAGGDHGHAQAGLPQPDAVPMLPTPALP